MGLTTLGGMGAGGSRARRAARRAANCPGSFVETTAKGSGTVLAARVSRLNDKIAKAMAIPARRSQLPSIVVFVRDMVKVI